MSRRGPAPGFSDIATARNITFERGGGGRSISVDINANDTAEFLLTGVLLGYKYVPYGAKDTFLTVPYGEPYWGDGYYRSERVCYLIDGYSRAEVFCKWEDDVVVHGKLVKAPLLNYMHRAGIMGSRELYKVRLGGYTDGVVR